jgi:PAS domain S-box-containing protein
MLIRFCRKGWRQYGLPVASVAIATGLRLLLAPFPNEGSPFLLFFAAVMFSSYYGLRGSGIVAGILAALASDYFFMRPYYRFAIQSVGDFAGITVFLFESAVICAGVMKLKESRQNAQTNQLKIVKQQEVLQQMNTALEQQVQERTQQLKEMNAVLRQSLLKQETIALELCESENRIQLALEASGDGWWDWDISTGTIHLSALGLRMLAYEDHELEQPSTLEQLTHPDDFPLVMETLQAHLKDPATALYRFDYRMLTKSGGWKWIANYGKVVGWDAEGQPNRMVGMHRDVNDRKLAEQELLKSEYVLRSFFDSASMMMGIGEVIRNDIRFVSINRAVAEFLSSTSEAIQNRFAGQLGLPEEITQLWIARFHESKRNETPIQFEHEYQTSEASIWLSATVSPIQGAQGRSQFSFIVEDVSARKQIESSIAASLQEKEVLLKEVHHRVKNNLQVICSLLNLQARAGQNAILTEQLKESRNRVKSMALVHEKLYQANSLSKIDFNEYVQDLAKHLFRSYSHKSLDISLKIEINPDILVDIDAAVSCGLIVNELISNAFKHAFEPNQPGEVYIQSFLDADHCLVLVIQDNGKGLPLSWSLAENKTLGLELVKDLTDQLKAKIEIESVIGAKFKITFPAKNN